MTGISLEDAVRVVTTTNPVYAVGNAEIRGIDYPVFKNIPGHTRALLEAARDVQPSEGDYLVFGDESWTYSDFTRDINRIAHALQHRFGVKKGQPVALAMRNCPEMLTLMMAITSVGGVVVFLNAWWTSEELDYALKDSGAKLVFADQKRMERLNPLIATHKLQLVGVRDAQCAKTYQMVLSASDNLDFPAQVIETDDDMAIMYSSGTTGHPKGVVQTHRGAMNAVYTWLMQAELAALTDPLGEDAPPPPRPAFLVVTPLFHVTATHPVFLLSLPAGAKIVLMDKWDVEEAVTLIERENITRILGVPTQSADLFETARRMGKSLDSLEFLGSGGAKRPAAQVGELAEAFPNAMIATGWGMTETNANGIGMAGPDYVARPGVAGRLYPPIQAIRFLDETGTDVPTGELGEITVKSACNMRCYLNKPEATAEVMQDGWLRTGDLGFIDEDGIITIVDRKKNIVIRGGENIACLDVEGALHRHPAVAEACAFSVPHPRLGEVVGAGIYVQPGEAATPEDIQTFLKEHIAHFKVPEHIWLYDTPLPRGATDKLDRRGLRAACLAQLETTLETP